MKINNIISKYAKMFSSLIIILYTCGFIIQSIYLSRFNIIILDLLKNRFITIGIPFIIHISILVYSSFLVTQMIHSKKIKSNIKRFIFSLLSIIIIAFIVGIFFDLISSISFSFFNVSIDNTLVNSKVIVSNLKLTGIAIVSMLIIFYVCIPLIIYILFIIIDLILSIKNRKFDRNIFKDNFKVFSKIEPYSNTIFKLLVYGVLALFFLSFSEMLDLRVINSNAIEQIRYSITILYLIQLIPIWFFSYINFIDSDEKEVLEQTDDDSNKSFISVFVSPLSLSLLLLNLYLYANVIYPQLHRNIGGGKILEVEIFPNNVEYEKLLKPFNGYFLIDENTRKYFIMATSNTKKKIITLSKTNYELILDKSDNTKTDKEVKNDKN